MGSDFILLSTIISKLENNNYYRVFAKSLARTATAAESLPPDDQLVREMFYHFIRENELQIHYRGCVVSLEKIESETCSRALENSGADTDIKQEEKRVRDLVWKNEIYIKVSDLKKLYANKCIVFPKSLLANRCSE